MKIYIILTAVICCLMIIIPLAFSGIYSSNTSNENAVTTSVTAAESNILF